MALLSLGGVAKLEIIPLKKNITETDTSWSLDNDAKVTCQFNPESLSMSKSNQWAFRTDIGDDVPEAVYGGGNSGSMSLNFLL